MPDQPLTRDAWVSAFVSELIRLRPDLTYSYNKFAKAVAQTEWAKMNAIAPQIAAKQWNQRVRSARP